MNCPTNRISIPPTVPTPPPQPQLNRQFRPGPLTPQEVESLRQDRQIAAEFNRRYLAEHRPK
jgi:hypothetical protein